MFVHIVCFKYKVGNTAAQRQEHKTRVRALADIDGVIEIKMGDDVIRSPRSYDMGLLILFRDQKAYEDYRDHPRHQPVGQLSISLCESIVAADFEAEGWSALTASAKATAVRRSVTRRRKGGPYRRKKPAVEKKPRRARR